MFTAGPVSKTALQKENAFYVLSFEVFISVITVQPEFHAWFKQEMFLCDGSFF
jgi:hypothetical protein